MQETIGAVLMVSIVVKNVMSAAAEAEVGELFHNFRESKPLQVTLEEMGHKPPATPVQSDKSISGDIANSWVKKKRTKKMCMRFYWVQDRVKQAPFNIFGNQVSPNWVTILQSIIRRISIDKFGRCNFIVQPIRSMILQGGVILALAEARTLYQVLEGNHKQDSWVRPIRDCKGDSEYDR